MKAVIERVFLGHVLLFEKLAPPIRPAPIITIPNWPDTRVIHHDTHGLLKCYTVVVRGNIHAMGRPGCWT